MRVFFAGGKGAVGRRLLPQLVAAGHEVVALCRSHDSAQAVRAAGATPKVADALDREALAKAVREARPNAVIHQLTALAGMPGNLRRFDQEFALTNRLRTEALDTMLDAAQEVGAQRFIAQSFCGWPQARSGAWVKSELDALEARPDGAFRHSHQAILHIEQAVPHAKKLVGIVLRYGVLYGPGTNFAENGAFVELVRRRKLPLVGAGTGVWSFTHVDDAASAALAALDHGQAGIYNIVDNDPARVSEWLPYLAQSVGADRPRSIPAWLGRLILGKGGLDWLLQGRGSSNSKAKDQLGWRPRISSWRDGFLQITPERQRAASLVASGHI